MNSMEEPVPSKHRSQRVVSLPCGHHVYVDTDASLIAVSGPGTRPSVDLPGARPLDPPRVVRRGLLPVGTLPPAHRPALGRRGPRGAARKPVTRFPS